MLLCCMTTAVVSTEKERLDRGLVRFWSTPVLHIDTKVLYKFTE